MKSQATKRARPSPTVDEQSITQQAMTTIEKKKKAAMSPPTSPSRGETPANIKRKVTNFAKPLLPLKPGFLPNLINKKKNDWSAKMGFASLIAKDWKHLTHPNNAADLIQNFVQTNTVVLLWS